MVPSLVETASSLKTLRALASSDDALCGSARGAFDAAVEVLRQRSRQQRNLNHSVHALLRKTGVTLRVPCELCTCPEPSLPPAALRQFLGMYGALLTELRGRPHALADIVHRGAGPPESAVQLLLCFVFGHLWQLDEQAALLGVAERLLSLRVQEAGVARALDAGALPERLLSAYLRVMPGGAAWLQAALGAQVQRVVDESERGLCLMADAMDVYLSLPVALKAEVDRDVECGEVASLGEHPHVVEVLSMRGVALCTSCEALLEGVLRAAPAAPAGLRRIARALRATGSAEDGSSGWDCGGSGGSGAASAVVVARGISQQLAGLSVRELKAMLAAAGVDAAGLLEKGELLDKLLQSQLPPAPPHTTTQPHAAAPPHVVPPPTARGDGGDGAVALPRELLLGLLLSPAAGCPEGFGVLLRCPVAAHARQSLLALAGLLHHLAQGGGGGVQGGSAKLAALSGACAEALCAEGEAEGEAEDEAEGGGGTAALTGEAEGVTMEGGPSAAEAAESGLRLPELPVEIPLGPLRRLHGWCAAHSGPLLNDGALAHGDTHALLGSTERARLLAELLPAIRVLSEVQHLGGLGRTGWGQPLPEARPKKIKPKGPIPRSPQPTSPKAHTPQAPKPKPQSPSLPRP